MADDGSSRFAIATEGWLADSLGIWMIDERRKEGVGAAGTEEAWPSPICLGSSFG